MEWIVFFLTLFFAVYSGFTVAVTVASVSQSREREANIGEGIAKGTMAPETPPGIIETKLELGKGHPITSTKKQKKTTKSPTTDECDPCKQSDFKGFGFNPGKCGCCPWPCCCKCVEMPSGPGCRALLDLCFIMDDSASVANEDWFIAKRFFIDVVSKLTSIGTEQFVSSITYSSNASLNWNLNDPETANAAALASSIGNLEKSGLFTNHAEALELAVNEVFVDGIDNPDAANVAVFMTNGYANFGLLEISGIAKQLRTKAKTICVGVSNEINMSELREICDEDNIFNVVDFQSLQTILESVQTKICPTPPVSEKCFCCCTPEQFWANGGASYYRRRW